MKNTSSQTTAAASRRAFLKNAVLGAAALAGTPAATGILAAAPAAKSKGTPTKIILAQLPVKTEHLRDFYAIGKKVVEATRKEPGNISYDLYRGASTPETRKKGFIPFLMVEFWRDQNAINAHNASAHFKDFFAAYEPIASGKPEVTTYDIVPPKAG
ncbi:MAG: antibiotic biosynthesis monooxygenase [Puniceicoccales bacterium]|nr:antibiotic biosynthesis monooxygenase [Puniceicoccales bacterium]